MSRKKRRRSARPMWTCPECGRRFANRNQWHSCASAAIDDHFEGADPVVRVLFDAVETAAREHGDFDVISNKTRIVFRARMSSIAFAPRKSVLRGHLCLGRRAEDSLFTRITTYSPRNHVHEFVLASLDDLTPRFLEYVAEACATGRQEHLAGPVEDPKPKAFWNVHQRLFEHGLLMEADAALPSVATLVAGEPVKGSWWGHEKGHAIFAVAVALHEHADVVATKLVNAKITYVHKQLFSALYRVATSCESWQTLGLSAEARRLLARVRKSGRLQASGQAAGELELRLLIHARSVHAESGKHEKMLETWEHWAETARLRPRSMKLETASRKFETIATAWEVRTGARVRLPWNR